MADVLSPKARELIARPVLASLAKKYLGVDSYPMRREGEVRIRFRVRTDHIAMQGQVR